MIILKGISVYEGISFAPVRFVAENQRTIKPKYIENVESELLRFYKALEETIKQLKKIYLQALSQVGESEAMIFEIHQMMVADGDFKRSIKEIITAQGFNAEYAVSATSDKFESMFENMDNEYMRERAVDVRDISQRLIWALVRHTPKQIKSEEPIILAARDFTPSQVIQLDKTKIKAIVTQHGNANSHTAILARSMNIPTIVSVGEDLASFNAEYSIVDAYTGEFYIDPDESTILEMREKYGEQEREKVLSGNF